jgi:flagellar biosynthesis/type III secretory pathway M-ring protein FliF/YscJ
MTTDLQSLLSDLAKAPLKAKLTAVISLLAVVGVLAVAGMVASKPHFVTLYAGLDDMERVAVEKALAEAGVRFRSSNPPGPHVVYVDESAFDRAQIAVATAEALKRAPSGINASDTGTSTIFMSSGERQQSMLKREWQETENLLQQLDFVSRATVTTSMPDSSLVRKRQPLSVSVALKLRGSNELSDDEAETVAKLVRFRFGVPAENVIISDQSGHILYDPSDDDEDGLDSRTLIDHATRYDRELAAKVNDSLRIAFGGRKALVTVTSEWNHDMTTSVAQQLDPDTVVMSSEKSETKTPQGAVPEVGGPAGTASNVPDGFGVDNAAVPSTGAPTAGMPMSETKDEKSVYEAGRSTIQTVTTAPRLARLSVSLVIDESLDAKRDEIIEVVKAAVGFDSARDDVIGVSTTQFAGEEGDVVEGEEGGEAAAPSEPSPALELLLTRGVEIVAALAFVVMLFLALRGSKKPKRGRAAGGASAGSTTGGGGAGAGAGAGGGGGLEIPDEDIDPALLARTQIEEIVRTDPRRVGEILSRWASDEAKVGAK